MHSLLEHHQDTLNYQQLVHFFMQTPTPLALMLGPSHIFVLVNESYTALIGRDPLSHSVSEVFCESEVAAFIPLLDQVYATGVPFVGKERPFHRKNSDGSTTTLALNFEYRPFRNENDAIVGVLAFVYDVTEQARSRLKAEESESRLRAIFSRAAVGFSASTLKGRFLEVNPRFCEICGYSQDELEGMVFQDLIDPDDRPRDMENARALVDGATPHSIMESRFVQKNGRIAWVRHSVSLVTDSDGEPIIIRVSEDVTEAREADRLRKLSEERYLGLADSMPQIVWTAGPDGLLDYFNKVWFDYSGTDYDDNVGVGWAKSVHPDDLPLTLERWTRALESGSIYENEFRLLSAQGEYRWFVVRAIPSKDSEGRVLRWYGTNTDIHNSKLLSDQLARATRDLESEQQKFRTIIADSSTSMAVLKGEQLIYEIANRSYLELFQNREIIGKVFTDALPELKDQAFPRIANTVFQTGVAYRDREAKAYLKRTADGPLEERYFDQSYTRMQDQEGKPYGIFIHAQEVTDRVKARLDLEETAERLRLAMDVANMGTWEIDPSTQNVTWSRRTREIFGVPEERRIRLEDALAYVHPEDRERVAAAVAEAMDPAGSGDYSIQHRLLRDDGSVVWASILGKSFFIESKGRKQVDKFTGIILDVTDKVLAEAELREAKEKAEAASAAKSGFLANMSHEIRTPIGAIMGFVSLIKDEDLTREMLAEYISIIERNSVQLLRIIDDILDLSKVEAGMMMIEGLDFSPIEMLSDFSSLMGFRAREKGINFQMKALSQLPAMINSDPTRIRQILTNIVGNAIKFTERGGVVLTVAYKDGFLEFEVADTGRGISAEEAEGLFQPFSQADASVTRKYGGTGLGLVLTRRLSEALGGSFALKASRLGQGSTFIARIKVEAVAGADFIRAFGFVPEGQRSITPPRELKDMSVLLVEDSQDNQTLYSIYLERAGAKVKIAGDGLSGCELALKGSYDVVLMDIQMPIMDGISAVKKLRTAGYSTPVVALTAHAMKDERERCLDAGFDEFLSKPLQRAQLIELLQGFAR